MGSRSDNGGYERTRPFLALSPGTVISHYRIVEKLGEGGMGVVYKATDTRLGRTVALKFLPPHLVCDAEAKARFEHEAKASSALNHPNICTIHEIDEFESHTFIAMECLDGLSLKDKIRSGPVGVEEAIAIALDVGEALREAHDSGIVHRDVKSSNIMVTRRGQAKITDFGLAKIAGETAVTQPGTLVGTVAYMSPEQAGAGLVDRRTDVWSLGVVIYETLTGRLPFQAEHIGALIHSVLNETPKPITSLRSGLPLGLERIVSKAMEKGPTKRYQRMDDLIVDLRNVRDGQAPGSASGTSSRRRAAPRRFLVSAGIIALSAAVLAVIAWTRSGPQPAAVAAENVLAVMYFDNLADPQDLEKMGEIATSLLITDLSESRYIRVISSQRLYDILKLIGREGLKEVDRSVAGEVAQKAGARWMLLGDILQVAPQIEIASQLVEVSTGQVRASQRVSGDPGQNIFSVIDKLTLELKTDLSLPGAALREEDPAVADVTTSSPDAYRCYVEGLEYSNKTYSLEAISSFRNAIEYDSTFAMAYYRLWYEVYYPEAEAKDFLAKAVRYSKKASRKEKAYIRYAQAAEAGDTRAVIRQLERIVETYPDEKEAFYHLGFYYEDVNDGEASIRSFRRAIELDPLYKLAYNALAYAYHETGDFEKSMWAINEYISLAPEEANPYDSRGDLYAWSGKIDKAIESYKKAIQIKPEYTNMRLGHMYLFLRQYDKAEECYRRLLGLDPYVRSLGRFSLAIIPAYQGKFREALDVLEAGLAADAMENIEGGPLLAKRALKAEIHARRGEIELALAQVQVNRGDGNRLLTDMEVFLLLLRGEILARGGRLREAEAVAQDLKNEAERREGSLGRYWSLVGEIQLAKGDGGSAAEFFEKAAHTSFTPEFPARLALARACLRARRLDTAVEELEAVLQRYDDQRAEAPIQAVEAHYLLGRAYEASGWKDRAAEKYREFLEIWKSADPGIPEIEDARRRLDHLAQS